MSITQKQGKILAIGAVLTGTAAIFINAMTKKKDTLPKKTIGVQVGEKKPSDIYWIKEESGQLYVKDPSTGIDMPVTKEQIIAATKESAKQGNNIIVQFDEFAGEQSWQRINPYMETEEYGFSNGVPGSIYGDEDLTIEFKEDLIKLDITNEIKSTISQTNGETKLAVVESGTDQDVQKIIEEWDEFDSAPIFFQHDPMPPEIDEGIIYPSEYIMPAIIPNEIKINLVMYQGNMIYVNPDSPYTSSKSSSIYAAKDTLNSLEKYIEKNHKNKTIMITIYDDRITEPEMGMVLEKISNMEKKGLIFSYTINDREGAALDAYAIYINYL